MRYLVSLGFGQTSQEEHGGHTGAQARPWRDDKLHRSKQCSRSIEREKKSHLGLIVIKYVTENHTIQGNCGHIL